MISKHILLITLSSCFCTHLNGFTSFQTFPFSISTQFFVYTQLVICLNTVFVYTVKTVLFQTIQFSKITEFKCQTALFDP